MLLPRLAWLALHLSVIASSAADSSAPNVFQPQGWLPPVPKCPESCEALFPKLEDVGVDGKVQYVEMQARGEPQSGLSFMFAWASDFIGQSCMFLQRAYGRESCRVEWTDHVRTMIFEPGRGAATAGGGTPQCSCENIHSVVVKIVSEEKHMLPCDASCAFAHQGGFAPRPHQPVCAFHDASLPQNHGELIRCMDEASCPMTDDRLQMAALRDPREMAVGRFYHIQQEHPEWLESSGLNNIEAFFLAMLPTICKWTSVRYRVFAQTMAARSTVYYYEDALYSPLAWHYNLLYYLGLQMPPAVIEWAAHAAAVGSPGLGIGDGDKHRAAIEHSNNRTFKLEVSEATARAGDEILSVWLPPVLLEKYGIVSDAT